MSKGNSIARCGGVPQGVRVKSTSAIIQQVTWIGTVRVDKHGRPRSKSYKAVYGRTPRRLRERGVA